MRHCSEMPKPTQSDRLWTPQSVKPLRGERVRHSFCDKVNIWRVRLQSRGGKITHNKGIMMRKAPLISLANMVEYATTPSAARRRSIIEQYHQPQVIKFDWHGASDVIFIKRACGSSDADNLIDFEKDRIRNQLSGEKEKDRRLRHILHLIELLEASDFSKLTVGAVPSSANDLSTDCSFGSLAVRVRPDLILSKPRFGAKGMDRGVLKCHNLSSFRLDLNSGPMFAVGLHVFAENVLGQDSTVGDL